MIWSFGVSIENRFFEQVVQRFLRTQSHNDRLSFGISSTFSFFSVRPPLYNWDLCFIHILPSLIGGVLVSKRKCGETLIILLVFLGSLIGSLMMKEHWCLAHSSIPRKIR